RVIVLTDISSVVGGYGEPDDTQSLIRLLLYANEMELEGLVATYSSHGHRIYPEYIEMILHVYGQVFGNLQKHDHRYPTQEKLQGLVKRGNPQDGPAHVGEGMDTEGSEWIIACADKEEDHPLWILVWGGTTDLAQALWKVKHTRGAEGYKQFKARLRVYAIGDQYAMGSRVRDENPDLFYIVSKDSFRGLYKDGDTKLVDSVWVDRHIRSGHGILGAAYPLYEGGDPWGRVSGIKEGDTTSLLYLINNGLGDPEHPEWGSWGGRFQPLVGKTFADAEDTVDGTASAGASVYRWREAFQNDFQARMDWCTGSYAECNHAPVAVIDIIGNDMPAAGDTTRLQAAASSDPDGDKLTFRWEFCREASTYQGEIAIKGEHTPTAELQLPANSAGHCIHILLCLTDQGEPPLTTYKRVVISVS
ncbi:MAG: hypothetical protein K0Q90_4363, partial [Paenibacillaceae bacterium]|nr:hypothetical protein [Paenibacillaceae bacterium]